MKRSGFAVMAQLIGLVKPLTGYMVLAVAMGLAGHLCAALITVLGAYAVLSVLGWSFAVGVAALFLTMGIFALLRGALRYAEQMCNHFIAFKLLALLRDKVFAALRTLCPAKLDGRDKGDLIALITADIELLEVFYAHTISPAAIAVLFSAVLCIWIGAYHPMLGLLALAAYVTVGLVVPLAASRLSADSGMKLRTKTGDLSSYVLDSLRGLSEVLQYAQGAQRLEELERRTDELNGEQAHMRMVAAANTAVTNTIVIVFDLLMLFSAAALYQQGKISFDGVLIPVFALFASFGPVIALANLGSTLQSTFAAGNRVLDLLAESPVVQEVHGQKDIAFAGAQAKGVSFSYGGEQILSDLSLCIPQNTIVGIVGRSGSGKSTLLKLLMRFWDPQQGSVQMSDVDIRQINTASLRSAQSLVTQETHLFRDSIRSNIGLAKSDATDEEIERACKKAAIHDFIAGLPKGYDTPVGELGDTLSGGERQRLGLARAFLHDAPMMLLDEPTSNLDSLNEAVILHSLHTQREGKAVVLVSHRASTMRIADRVHSVEHGRMS